MKIFAFIIFITLSFGSSASQKRGILKAFDSNVKVINKGEVFEGILELLPAQEIIEDDIQKAGSNNVDFSPYLLMSSIESIGPSPNNVDVYVVKAKFIVKEATSLTNINIRIGEEIIPVEIRGLKIQEGDFKNYNGIMISDLDYSGKSSNNKKISFLVISLILLSFVLLFVIRRLWKKKLKRTKRNKQVNYWVEVFNKASERRDIESIFLKKDEWESFVRQDELRIFENSIKPHLYKKNWTDAESEEIRASKDNVLKAFERGNTRG